jgi:hypothetical protein
MQVSGNAARAPRYSSARVDQTPELFLSDTSKLRALLQLSERIKDYVREVRLASKFDHSISVTNADLGTDNFCVQDLCDSR